MARDERLLFHAKSLLIRAIHGNDAPAIVCKAPRNHAPLANPKDGVLATSPCAPHRPTCATLPLDSVGYENEINERGERTIWLDHAVLRSSQGHARAGRELQRRHFATGEGDDANETQWQGFVTGLVRWRPLVIKRVARH
jgi:hypothetical protein